jgi:hypothetical protein
MVSDGNVSTLRKLVNRRTEQRRRAHACATTTVVCVHVASMMLSPHPKTTNMCSHYTTAIANAYTVMLMNRYDIHIYTLYIMNVRSMVIPQNVIACTQQQSLRDGNIESNGFLTAFQPLEIRSR